jgi:hypothetical protein
MDNDCYAVTTGAICFATQVAPTPRLPQEWRASVWLRRFSYGNFTQFRSVRSAFRLHAVNSRPKRCQPHHAASCFGLCILFLLKHDDAIKAHGFAD